MVKHTQAILLNILWGWGLTVNLSESWKYSVKLKKSTNSFQEYYK